ncbi:MAG: aminopeptidase [Solobacterium sp.]|nr:aminopeptidase [Solobacterium sp.]
MKTVWETYDAETREKMEAFSKDYRTFLNRAKTEREFVRETIRLAEENGFQEIGRTKGPWKRGERLYAVNRGKNVVLYVIGERPIEEGINILGAHIDSPRMDVKQNPLYEKDGFALLDTHYYGGIKKYQWVARGMALHGVVVKKDGTAVDVVIGEEDDDPVIGVSDILVHLAAKQMQKKAAEAIEGEQLNLLAGSIPAKDEKKDAVRKYLLNLLKEKYGIEEEDFVSAELEAVPAEKARNFGIDNSMIMAYGQDDKICAYTNLRAILDVKTPARTSCVILVDKEEIGSVGATGMESRWFENTVIELLDGYGKADLVTLNRTLSNSRMLSSDVSAGLDPNYAEMFEPKNSAYLGRGICFNKYTGARGKSHANDANAEYLAKIRRVMDEEKIVFQTAEIGKVDEGGGGTIAFILARLNMDVVDAGIPVLNMHSPSEISSKADLYEGYRAYLAFLNRMD